MTWDNNKNTFDSRPSVPSDEKLTASEWNNHVSDQKGRVPFGPLANRPSAANASNGDVWFVTDLANDAGVMTKVVSGSWEIMGLGDSSNKLPDVFAESVKTEKLKRDEVKTRIHLSSDTTIQEGTITEISFDTVSHDDDSEADLSDNGITVNEDGDYEITASAQFTDDISADARFFVRVAINGSSVIEGNTHTSISDFILQEKSDTMELSANDTISVDVLWDSGGAGSATLQGNERTTYLTVEEAG